MFYKISASLFTCYLFVGFICLAQDAHTNNSSTMKYLKNKRITLGIDLGLGGAVTYLTDQENGGENMINSYDWGRQIQMSYYSGPWPYIGPKGEKPTPEWEGLGWNPIQSGDAGGNRSRILSFEQRGDSSFFVRSVPMQWPHRSGVAGECVFACLYTLRDNIVTMEATILNSRSDSTQYPAGSQEMPAVYTNGPWYQLVTYLGDQPFTGAPSRILVDKLDQKGWPWIHFYTPENWVALVDKRGYGIGVFQPEVMKFNGGFHPNDSHKGKGLEKDVATGHIAPVGTQILDHNIKWTYKTSFVLGTVKDIRDFAKANWQVPKHPLWHFNDSRSNWYYSGAVKDSGFPIPGYLDLSFDAHAALQSPVTFWRAEDNASLEITGEIRSATKEMDLRIELQPFAPADNTDWLNWSEGTHQVEQEQKAKAQQFPKSKPIILKKRVIADGTARTYSIDLKLDKAYVGAMKSVKITFENIGTAKITRVGFTQ